MNLFGETVLLLHDQKVGTQYQNLSFNFPPVIGDQMINFF